MKRSIYLKTMSLNKALTLWRERLQALGLTGASPPETVSLPESLGRVTAAPASALISSPFYHSSAMDGYAVRFADTFGATETKPKRLQTGEQAVYVDTGAPLPDGGKDTPFNAVIMVEDVNVMEGSIEFTSAVSPWQNVRTVGEDIVASELIIPENHVVRPVDMGAMLAGGLTEISVRRRPRVAIIPTGSEIVEPGTKLEVGDIIEFTSRVLSGMVTEWGAEPVRMDIVPDNMEKLKNALSSAAREADLIVTIAGASAGSEDFTEQTIASLGEVVLHGIDIRPGKPVMLGIASGKPVIGLPGYPVASHLCFNLLARPLVMGWLAQEEPPTAAGTGMGETRATLSRQVASKLGQEEFVRVKVGQVGETLVATPLGRGAGLMMSLVRADGLMTIPADSEGLAGGAEVDVQLMRPMREITRTAVSIGSHDNSMDVLANFLRKRHPALSLSSAHVGSMGGLVALKRGEAHMAPVHLLEEESGKYNVPFLKRLLSDTKVHLINMVQRTQGLMVPKGNPKGIRGMEDLRRPDITFINRQRGSGTRLLLDKALTELGITPDEVAGYEREEYTHMSVASGVSTGLADTGLGALSAARAMGLEFIPVTEERYDLAIPEEHLGVEAVSAILGILRDDAEFRRAVEEMGGYDVSLMGKVMYKG